MKTRTSLNPFKLIVASAMLMLAMLFSVPDTHAQQYDISALTLATNGLEATAGVTTNTTAVITATKYDELALSVTGAATGANTGNLIVYFTGSVDGTNYSRYPIHSVSVIMNGTTAVTGVTNVPLGSVGYLRVDSMTNSGAAAITNITIRVGKKPRKDG
jgi:hypothetical protein